MRHTFLAAVLCLLVSFPAAAERMPLWQLVPADSVGVLVLPDLGKTRAAFKQTNVYKLFGEPELQAFVKELRGPLQGKLDEAAAEFEKNTGITVKQLFEMLNGEVGVAFLGMDEQEKPRFLFSLEFGKNLAVIQTLLARFQKSVGGEQVTVETTAHKAYKIQTIAGRGGRRGAAWSLAGERLLLSIHKDVVAGALDRLSGDNDGSPKRLEGVPTGGSLILHVNLEALFARFGKQMPKEAHDVLGALGVTDWRSFSYASGIEGGRLTDTLKIRTNGKRRGLTALLRPGVIDDPQIQQQIPGDAVGGMFGRMDLAGAYAQLLEAVKAIDREVYGELTETIGGFEKKCGVKLPDLLGSFGSHYVAYSVMPGAGLFPRGVTRLQLASVDRFLAGVRGLAKGTGQELVSSDYKGRKLLHLRAKLGKLGQNPFEGVDEDPALAFRLLLVFVPAHFYVDGSWAVFAENHQNLLDEIDRAARHQPGPLSALPAGTIAYGHSDSSRVMAGLYNTALPLLTGIEGLLRTAGVPYDARHLPRASTLLKHLGKPSYFNLSYKDQTIAMRSSGNVGGAPVLAVGVAAGLAWMGVSSGPKMKDAPERPRRLPEGETKRIRMRPRPAVHPAVGRPAADFTLKTPDGKAVTLSKLRGKVVLIDFWATWCGPCKRVMPTLQKLHAAYKEKGVVVLGVNVWDEKGKAARYMTQQKYDYPLLLEGDAVAKQYQVKGIPTLYVVGKDGKIAFVHVGYSDDVAQQLERVIGKALAGK